MQITKKAAAIAAGAVIACTGVGIVASPGASATTGVATVQTLQGGDVPSMIAGALGISRADLTRGFYTEHKSVAQIGKEHGLTQAQVTGRLNALADRFVLAKDRVRAHKMVAQLVNVRG